VDADGTELQRALELAYRYLNRRERTVHEVRVRLEEKGTDPAVIDQAVAFLTGQSTVDDVRFARLFVEDKRELERWGAERIRRGLLARGVERELVEQALIEAGEEEDELERALGLLRRRFSSPPRERRERDRALGVLIRKGYDPELALDALAAYARDAA